MNCLSRYLTYHIRPNYCTVCLGFSKLLENFVVKYVSTYTRDTLIKKRSVLSNDAYVMFLCFFFSDFLYISICCGYSFELHRQVDAIQMGTHNVCFYKVVDIHLNCINAIQMGTHTICFYKEVDKKYTCCNLKTMKLLDSALIGVCGVIRSNMIVPKKRSSLISIFLISSLKIYYGYSFEAPC